MRSVPHRVVCLIGLDDGAFPRRGVADGDDILARDPRSGERDVRSEDRQLFLDAICAAREHLLITYTGADPRTGAEVPPCVPLGELLDAIDATAIGPDGGPARHHVVVRHPLQPFDRRNFEPDALGRPGAFSFDRAALAGAVAGSGERVDAPPLVGAPLSPPAAGDIALDDLVRFFQHPARGFLRQRLDVSTYDRDDDPADAVTVELDGLQGWAIGDRLLQRCLTGTSRRTAAALERLRGELPPEQLGAAQLDKITRRVDAVLTACEAELHAPPTAIETTIALSDGRTLSGTVPGVRDRAILAVTYSTLAAKHRLTAWIRLLALVASTGESGWRAVTVGRQREDARRSVLANLSPDTALRCLELLVGIRDAGLCEPLPLALETSAEYAARRHRGASIDDSLPAARKKWEAGTYRPEHAEPEHVLVHGERSALTELLDAPALEAQLFPDEPTRFGSLALLVWAPLLTVEQEF